MPDSPAAVADDEEAVKKAEHSSGHREKIHRGNYFSMVLQEGQAVFRQAVFRRVSPASCPSQITGNCSFGEIQSQFQKFSVNLGSSPSWILVGHLSEQFSKFESKFRSARTVTTEPSPIEAKNRRDASVPPCLVLQSATRRSTVSRLAVVRARKDDPSDAILLWDSCALARQPVDGGQPVRVRGHAETEPMH